MLTHLFRTFHSSPDNGFDTGCASNDDCHVAATAAQRKGPSRPIAQTTAARDSVNSLLEEYALGGYAGI